MFSLEEVKDIVNKALAERDEKLRLEYDHILRNLLAGKLDCIAPKSLTKSCVLDRNVATCF